MFIKHLKGPGGWEVAQRIMGMMRCVLSWF